MTNEQIWEKLEDFYTINSDIKCINASDAEILDAEKELNVIFSDFYRYFLKYQAVSSINGIIINGLHSSKSTKSLNWSVLHATKQFKLESDARLIDFKGWYIVSKNILDEKIGVNNKGEVWSLQHNSIFGKNKIAGDFEEFIDQLLKN